MYSSLRTGSLPSSVPRTFWESTVRSLLSRVIDAVVPSGRAFLGTDLELVRPAAVVRHRPSTEGFRIELARVGRVGHRRIVDEHDEGLALHIHALVIVPLEFGRHDAVPDEHQLRVLAGH